MHNAEVRKSDKMPENRLEKNKIIKRARGQKLGGGGESLFKGKIHPLMPLHKQYGAGVQRHGDGVKGPFPLGEVQCTRGTVPTC